MSNISKEEHGAEKLTLAITDVQCDRVDCCRDVRLTQYIILQCLTEAVSGSNSLLSFHL